tara:strand:+ start:223 stop:741 length:519 start_codon:yes stop_codon:yes gene_type:complete
LNSLNKKIPLGEILKPHGIKGELKILFYNEESKSLQKDQKVFLESPQKNIIEYKIERIFYSFRKNRIKFFDINTIDEADDLRGYIVNIDRSDLPEINDSEYYLSDLVGYSLIDKSNKNYGKVIEVLALPANSVLNVSKDDKEYLIPLIDDVVLEVNQNQKVIIIDPIEGLFI